MLQENKISYIKGFLSGLCLIFIANSSAWADQVSLSYIDERGDAQILTVDASSADGEHAKLAPMIGENGAHLTLNKSQGDGSVVEIAEALATAAPLFAADIAQALTALAPEDKQAIVDAVNSVTGVDTNAVLAAVHFGPPIRIVVPPVEQSAGFAGAGFVKIERKPSRN